MALWFQQMCKSSNTEKGNESITEKSQNTEKYGGLMERKTVRIMNERGFTECVTVIKETFGNCGISLHCLSSCPMAVPDPGSY